MRRVCGGRPPRSCPRPVRRHRRVASLPAGGATIGVSVGRACRRACCLRTQDVREAAGQRCAARRRLVLRGRSAAARAATPASNKRTKCGGRDREDRIARARPRAPPSMAAAPDRFSRSRAPRRARGPAGCALAHGAGSRRAVARAARRDPGRSAPLPGAAERFRRGRTKHTPVAAVLSAAPAASPSSARCIH